MLPCIIFEDEHLLVVNKPAGLNTHAPSPYGGEGIFDWLRNREERWASLAIIHRLDKETSGVLVFSKTKLANRSLTEQFTRHGVRKKYILLTDRKVPKRELLVRSSLVRVGDKYVGRLPHQGAGVAETRFRPAPSAEVERLCSCAARSAMGRQQKEWPAACELLEAIPLTGRTHQIRVHAAESGFPILGDRLYAGTAAARVYLHAVEIAFEHPATGQKISFEAPADFEADARLQLRTALLEPELTNCFRVLHGASDGQSGFYVDKLGDYLLVQTEGSSRPSRIPQVDGLMRATSTRGVYHKTLTRQIRRSTSSEASPQHWFGQRAPERFMVRENGIEFELSFNEGYSVGLFVDQRENRRRLLTGRIAAGFPLYPDRPGAATRPLEVLNTFAYTCAFSVCSAKAGARTTSLDLSRKYLEWGKRNFILNGLDPASHDFIFGDVFDWLRRLQKKGRRFGLILLDPPTFSASKQQGVFRAREDYAKLVSAALPLLEANGVLFASSNTAGWTPEDFLSCIHRAVAHAKRKVLQQQYFPQPPDFPISRAEPGYLKTVWLRVD